MASRSTGSRSRAQPQYGRSPPQHGQPQQGQPQYGQEQYGRDPRGGQPGQGWQPASDASRGYDPRDPRQAPDQQRTAGRHGHAAGHGGHGGGHAAGHAGGRAAGQRGADGGAADPAVAADRRLSTMGYKRAVLVGAAQILALLPGISRDGIVTVTGMWRGLTRQDAVRFSFLLSAPVILAAGALKAKDLTGPLSTGIHGPILVGIADLGCLRLPVPSLPDEVLQRGQVAESVRYLLPDRGPRVARLPGPEVSKQK